MNDPLIRECVPILSPLRYPGSKRRLGAYLAQTLKINKLRPKLFVEPFAGGLSVSLQLLKDGLVEKIAFGERDPLVASFWKTVFNDADWLVREIPKVELSLENWRYFKKRSFRSDRRRALACLFLNRTSFSGILANSAGPIGGTSQNSKYGISCRFNPTTLIRRIRAASELADKVCFVHQGSWQETLNKAIKIDCPAREKFYYLDPPFYHKARALYRFYFNEEDHTALHDRLFRLKSNWLLSYDPAEAILDKYTKNGNEPERVGLLYSMAGSSSLNEVEELIITNLTKLPSETRLWRKTDEWKRERKSIVENANASPEQRK